MAPPEGYPEDAAEVVEAPDALDSPPANRGGLTKRQFFGVVGGAIGGLLAVEAAVIAKLASMRVEVEELCAGNSMGEVNPEAVAEIRKIVGPIDNPENVRITEKRQLDKDSVLRFLTHLRGEEHTWEEWLAKGMEAYGVEGRQESTERLGSYVRLRTGTTTTVIASHPHSEGVTVIIENSDVDSETGEDLYRGETINFKIEEGPKGEEISFQKHEAHFRQGATAHEWEMTPGATSSEPACERVRQKPSGFKKPSPWVANLGLETSEN